MRERFVNEFMAQLNDIIPDRYLLLIKQKLDVYISNYEISKRETSLAEYTGFIPDCYKIYVDTRKIEGMSEKSLKDYNIYLIDLFRYFNKPLEQITTNDLRVYLYNIQQERNICNRTLDHRRTVINTFFEWCTSEGYLNKNPCKNINKINFNKKDVVPLTKIELEQVRDACRTTREKALVEFIYSTGARVTEVERMKIEDINFDKCEVLLFGKGDKYRKSYISARCKLYLQKYLKERNGEDMHLFLSERSPYNHLKKPGIEKIIKDIGIRSNVNRSVYPHLLRHTMATDMLERNVPITDIQRILGHVNVNTTLEYAKVSDNQIKNNHNRSIN